MQTLILTHHTYSLQTPLVKNQATHWPQNCLNNVHCPPDGPTKIPAWPTNYSVCSIHSLGLNSYFITLICSKTQYLRSFLPVPCSSPLELTSCPPLSTILIYFRSVNTWPQHSSAYTQTIPDQTENTPLKTAISTISFIPSTSSRTTQLLTDRNVTSTC